MNVPIIKFEVEGMRHTVHVALASYAMKMDEQVKLAIDRALTPEAVQAVVDITAKTEIEEAIKQETVSFFRYGVGRKAVREAVAQRLAEYGDTDIGG